MKAVAFTHSRPISAEDALLDVDVPTREPRHHDLLVEVRAVSVNPVDTKLRRNDEPLGERRILGFAQAAALPLTALTAWEMLFDRFRIPRDQSVPGTLLVVGGAGGVGSMAVQLAAQLTDLTVIATASRPETVQWCLSLGAHHVIDHRQNLAAQIAGLGLTPPDYIFITTNAAAHWFAMTELLAPEGSIGIVEQGRPLDTSVLMRKCGTLHTEYVFARGMLQTPSMSAQHRTLEAVAHLVDNGTLKTTMTENYGRINAANLKRAHAVLEAGTAIGKIVLEGF